MRACVRACVRACHFLLIVSFMKVLITYSSSRVATLPPTHCRTQAIHFPPQLQNTGATLPPTTAEHRRYTSRATAEHRRGHSSKQSGLQSSGRGGHYMLHRLGIVAKITFAKFVLAISRCCILPLHRRTPVLRRLRHCQVVLHIILSCINNLSMRCVIHF